MAVQAAQVSVGASPTSVLAADVGARQAVIRNAGSASVFLGPAGVSTSNGYELTTGSSVEVLLTAGDELFGIVATGTEAVHVLSA